jgi:hypothetical protein
MLRFFRKNRFHILVWAGMLIYLVFAQNLYTYFFLPKGKPTTISTELPEMTDQIQFHVDVFESTVFNGQYLYLMSSWAFSTADPAIPPGDYERQLVLISDNKNYFFSIESYDRPDIQTGYQSLGIQLTNAGFLTQISQDVIEPGTYQIGIVFHNPRNGSTNYSTTNKYLIRTPNQLKISDSPTGP